MGGTTDQCLSALNLQIVGADLLLDPDLSALVVSESENQGVAAVREVSMVRGRAKSVLYAERSPSKNRVAGGNHGIENRSGVGAVFWK